MDHVSPNRHSALSLQVDKLDLTDAQRTHGFVETIDNHLSHLALLAIALLKWKLVDQRLQGP